MSQRVDADDLQSFFTDVEHLREAFAALVAAPTLSKRILVIHGVGGIGKTSLLRMFRLHCKNVKTPVALASGDESKSAPAILADWENDLKADGVHLKKLGQTLQHYRLIQAKAEDKARESQQKIGDLAGKAAGKIAETAAGAAIGAAIGSAIPGLGTLVGALGGMGAESLVGWLHGQGFSHPEIDLLLDPTGRLTDDFLLDIEAAASKRRLVVMLDTFEQLSALEDWGRDLAQRLPANLLLVISGRAVPNWSRAWPAWLAQARVEELQPMSEEVMRTLIGRYYALLRGDQPDAKQVEAIIRFGRGLPVVINSAVRLWVEYGVEDFEAVKPEVVADLVDRLREGVPQELIPILEAAAALRYFNKELLRAVTGLEDVNRAYDELRRFPFVRPRLEGLALHDAVREIMDEHLHVHDPERHRLLHERAAAYFGTQIERRAGDDFKFEMERLYHSLRADESAGCVLFQQKAEELTRSRLANRLRTLLNDAGTYPLEMENSRLWREYYAARQGMFDFKMAEAEKVFQRIDQSQAAEAKLKAYALCDWGEILQRSNRLGEPGGGARATQVLERALRLAPVDAKLVFAYSHLRGVFIQQGDSQRALSAIQPQLKFFQDRGDTTGVLETLAIIRGLYALLGDWPQAYKTEKQFLQLADQAAVTPFLRLRLIPYAPWLHPWTGRCKEVEDLLRDIIEHENQVGDQRNYASHLADLGHVLGLQDKFEEMAPAFAESADINHSLGRPLNYVEGFWGAALIRQGGLADAEAHLLESLRLKRDLHDDVGLPEVFDWLAILHEIAASQSPSSTEMHHREAAEDAYRQSLSYRWTGRRNWEAAALAGLVRLKHAQGDLAAIPPLLAEAGQLAQQYQYNDHLASLRLTQAHVAWDGQLAEWGQGFDAALGLYRQALIYALRFNRFLLDEALSGRPQGTPLRPVIPACLSRGDEGRRMLAALRDGWTTGANDAGAPRPDTISPLPEGISLLEAERLARQREPGNGLPQKTVVEQIEAALE